MPKRLSGREKVVVIVNDFKRSGYRWARFWKEARKARPIVKVMPVADGCVCCSAGDDHQ
ncbi:MAG: hypothetical protein U0894_03765 [Pirellulales bacterium]